MPQMPLLVAINGCTVQILASVTLSLSVSVTLDISVSHPTPDHMSQLIYSIIITWTSETMLQGTKPDLVPASPQ